MRIDFERSRRSTVGVEWELMLVDPATGELLGAAPSILAAVRARSERARWTATAELMTNTIEVTSGIGDTVDEAIADIRHAVAAVAEASRAQGVELVSAGSHPFANWFDQRITDKTRYTSLVEHTQWWGRNMMIWGVHVHIGVEDVSKVMPLVAAVSSWLPHLQALSASSPFWSGDDTGYASNRALVFQQLPTAGLPWQLETWDEYVAYLDSMQRAGIITEPTQSRWDVRPAPRWGTIEIRACDGVSTLAELAAIAALTQCLVDDFSARLDAGETLSWLPGWYTRENKWRAARFGLDAEVITDDAGSKRLVRDDLVALVERYAPDAERLGCATELAGVTDILATGAGYERQRSVARLAEGDLRAVVEHMRAEFTQGHPLEAGTS